MEVDCKCTLRINSDCYHIKYALKWALGAYRLSREVPKNYTSNLHVIISCNTVVV